MNGLVITRLKVVPFIATECSASAWCREVVGEQYDSQHAGHVVERAVGDVSQSGVAARAPGVDSNVLAVLAAIVLRNTVFGGVCLRLAQTKPPRARVVSPPID